MAKTVFLLIIFLVEPRRWGSNACTQLEELGNWKLDASITLFFLNQ